MQSLTWVEAENTPASYQFRSEQIKELVFLAHSTRLLFSKLEGLQMCKKLPTSLFTFLRQRETAQLWRTCYPSLSGSP
eukprot:c40755_g1_i1 orf=1-231(-)